MDIMDTIQLVEIFLSFPTHQDIELLDIEYSRNKTYVSISLKNKIFTKAHFFYLGLYFNHVKGVYSRFSSFPPSLRELDLEISSFNTSNF